MICRSGGGAPIRTGLASVPLQQLGQDVEAANTVSTEAETGWVGRGEEEERSGSPW